MVDWQQSRDRAASKSEDGCNKALRAKATVEGEAESPLGVSHPNIAEYTDPFWPISQAKEHKRGSISPKAKS